MSFAIFDLDGTLADLDHRLHLVKGPGKKDWDAFHARVSEDEPIAASIEVFNALYRDSWYIQIWSGRSEVCRPQTVSWLMKHVECFHPGTNLVRMRPAGNYVPDNELKESWLLELGDDDKPDLVVDDRKQVVEMWRRHGVRCFQVAEGDY